MEARRAASARSSRARSPSSTRTRRAVPRQPGRRSSMTVVVIVVVRARARRRSLGGARGGRVRGRCVAFGALGLLGFLDATYLAGPFHFGRHGGAAAYWAFVVGGRARAGRRVLVRAVADSARPSTGCSSALGIVVVLHVVDLVTGAHLEWNTVFGYSPTIGIRFVGQGNLTFAQLVAAAVLFAGLLAWRVAPPRGVRIAHRRARGHRRRDGRAVLGQRLRRRVSRPRAGVRAAGLAAARPPSCGGAASWASSASAWPRCSPSGVVDLLRPADRPHPRRQVLREGGRPTSASATLVIRRKAAENLSVLGHSVLLGCDLRRRRARSRTSGGRRPRSLRAIVAAHPDGTGHGASASSIVAVLGFALNDSGITIPGHDGGGVRSPRS